MALVENTSRIGPYEILREIGRGGMGVVYAARDSRLDRDVAVKALPETLAHHPERLARFQREARLLASLNHPHIASIHGLEELDGRCYLVLEYVEGETLEAMLKRRGALPVEEALNIALQIARAVDAAHEKGVIHRDLKPANIKFTLDGQVKVLDFGLAKTLEGGGSSLAGESGEVTQPPPGSSIATIPGLVLGSPGYLSPEQARGQPADRRTDVFSFGCILYEMLTGTSLFAGQSIADSIGATLHKDPDWTPLPPDTPPVVRLLLRRALQKDPRRRLRDMADVRLDLEEAIADPTGSTLLAFAAADVTAARKPPSSRSFLVLASIALLCLGALGGWMASFWRAADSVPARLPVVRFQISVPPGSVLADMEDTPMNVLAMSPDGSLLVYRVEREDGHHLLLHDLPTGRARELPAAKDAAGPFFSPDGRWLAFWRQGQLQKLSLEGGPASPICRIPAPLGSAAWLSSGRIVFAGNNGEGLFVVDAQGREPSLLLPVDRTATATPGGQKPIMGFNNVKPLPDGVHVIASIWDGSMLDDYAVVVVNSETSQLRRILSHASQPNVLESGHLVFLRNATLLALEFDMKRLEPVGAPVPVLEGVLTHAWADAGHFVISPGGTIAYVPGGRVGQGRRLVRLDAEGLAIPVSDEDSYVGNLALSPNGRHLAVLTLRRRLELWAYDLERRTKTLVNGEGEAYDPVWSPDGLEIAFAEESHWNLARKAVFSTTPREIISEGGGYFPSAWTPDGRKLIVTSRRSAGSRGDVVQFDLSDWQTGSEQEPQPLIATPASEWAARLSPDGRWLLFLSDVAGRTEVCLARYPFDGQTWQISLAGGALPMWDLDGKAAYFVNPQRELMDCRLELDDEGEPRISTPRRLFDLKPVAATSAWNYITAMPGGEFIAVGPAPWEGDLSELTMILNWGQLVAERVESARPRR